MTLHWWLWSGGILALMAAGAVVLNVRLPHRLHLPLAFCKRRLARPH
jgi:hypothetical protein